MAPTGAAPKDGNLGGRSDQVGAESVDSLPVRRHVSAAGVVDVSDLNWRDHQAPTIRLAAASSAP